MVPISILHFLYSSFLCIFTVISQNQSISDNISKVNLICLLVTMHHYMKSFTSLSHIHQVKCINMNITHKKIHQSEEARWQTELQYGSSCPLHQYLTAFEEFVFNMCNQIFLSLLLSSLTLRQDIQTQTPPVATIK